MKLGRSLMPVPLGFTYLGMPVFADNSLPPSICELRDQASDRTIAVIEITKENPNEEASDRCEAEAQGT